jgi:hypothetical protein
MARAGDEDRIQIVLLDETVLCKVLASLQIRDASTKKLVFHRLYTRNILEVYTTLIL